MADNLFCGDCNYSAERWDHYQRHLVSKKHLAILAAKSAIIPVRPFPDSNTEPPTPSAEVHVTETEVQEPPYQLAYRPSELQSVDFGLLYSEQLDDENVAGTSTAADKEPSSINTEPTAQQIKALGELLSKQDNLSDWFPFKERTEALLYCVFFGGNVIWSDIHMEATLAIVRSVQRNENIQKCSSLCDIKSFILPGYEYMIPEEHVDSKGRSYFLVPPESVLKMVLSHPKWSAKLCRFPRKLNGNTVPYEQNEGTKWFSDAGSPSYNGFFTGDTVAVPTDKCYFKIYQFFLLESEDKERPDIMRAVGRRIILADMSQDFTDNTTSLVFIESAVCSFDVHDFQQLPSLSAIYQRIQFIESRNGRRRATDQEKRKIEWCHRLRTTDGTNVVSVPLNLFCDFTSGTTSKKMYPVATVMYQASGLPVSMKSDIRTIFMASASEDAEVQDMLSVVSDHMNNIHKNGVKAFDATTKQESIVNTICSCIVCDTTMTSALNYHLGHTATFFCHRCMAYWRNVDDFHAHEIVPPLKTKEFIQSKINEMRQPGLTPAQRYAIGQPFGVKDVGIDSVYKLAYNRGPIDTPFERLHQVDLGVLRISQKNALDGLDEVAKQILESYLQQFPSSSFSNKLPHAITKYFGSMHGKEYAQLAQTAPFAFLFGIEPPAVIIHMLMHAAMLSKLLRSPPSNATHYDRIMMHCAAVDERLGEVDLNNYRKPKLHHNLHLPEDLMRYGSTRNYSADKFEEFNGDVRRMIQHTNQHNLSRDVSFRECKRKIIQHMLSGGYFQVDGQWRQAGGALLSLANQPVFRKVLFLDDEDVITQTAGTLRKATKTPCIPLNTDVLYENIVQLKNDHQIRFGQEMNVGDASVRRFKAVTGRNNRLIKIGSDILLANNEIARLHDLFSLKLFNGQIAEWACVLPYDKLRTINGEIAKHDLLDCQIVELLTDSFLFVDPSDIMQSLSLVHFCQEPTCFKDYVNCRYVCSSNENKLFLVNKFRISHLKDFY